jgi:hypothetical protein
MLLPGDRKKPSERCNPGPRHHAFNYLQTLQSRFTFQNVPIETNSGAAGACLKPLQRPKTGRIEVCNDIKEFADSSHLKVKHDECGDPIIIGITGHIGEGYNGEILGLYVDGKTPRKWNAVRRSVDAAGMTIRQNGDSDGVLTFDPANSEQARLAIRAARIRTRRIPSPAQLAVLATARAMRLKAA